MGNEIIESAGMEPVVSQSDLEQALKVAERNEELCRKIKIMAIKQTNISDWVDMDGKPYLQSKGAEKIARLFGISWRICEGYPMRETQSDDKGTYYFYTFKGEFEMGGKTIEAIGTCSQRDKFFGRLGKELKAESEVDVTNIIRKANTNMEVNGITRLLGIRSMSWEDLAEAGIQRNATGAVNFKSKEAQTVEGLISEGSSRSGEKNGKKWTVYNITVNGIRMSTFDNKIGAMAIEAKTNMQPVLATYKNDGKGNKIEALEILQSGDLDAAAQEPTEAEYGD